MAKSEFFKYQIQNGNGFKIMASKWLYSWTALRQICFYQPKIVSIFEEIEKKDIHWPPRGKTHDTHNTWHYKTYFNGKPFVIFSIVIHVSINPFLLCISSNSSYVFAINYTVSHIDQQQPVSSVTSKFTITMVLLLSSALGSSQTSPGNICKDKQDN